MFDAPAGIRIGAPMAVLCIGQNYAARAAESGSEPPLLTVGREELHRTACSCSGRSASR